MKFIIEGRLPGMNEIINAARYNRFAGAAQKKKETRRCMFAIIAASLPVYTKRVKIHFAWYEPNMKRDVGNIRSGEKFICDALVELGKIPNDNQKWVGGMSDEFHHDPVRPRIEVEITEL